MGIREELQADIAEAFSAADELFDAVYPFVGTYSTTTGFDPVTETGVTLNYSYTGRGVFASYSLNRIDGVNILHGDVKLIALTNEVEGDGPPAVGHEVQADAMIGGSVDSFSVISIKTDPTKATYTIQLRRK
ncbi:putative head-closure protein [Erwinia phage Gungnir39]|nr:putative head-closure protein [Erwinia phage Gungnir39]